MNEATLKNITAELRDKLVGRKFGKIFVLGREKLAVDFRREDGAYLLLSASPNEPRLFLIRRKVKELSDLSVPPGTFANVLRKNLTHAILTKIEKQAGERIVEFVFEARDDAGLDHSYTLAVQLTGRSSNIFLIDSDRRIVESIRETFGEGQTAGTLYEAPVRPADTDPEKRAAFGKDSFDTLSEALDSHYREKEAADAFRSVSESAKGIVRTELRKLKRLKKKLSGDLKRHGEPEEWKRRGDLINANIATAKRDGDTTVLIDYFDESLPEIELEIDKNLSLSEAAEKQFRKYTKARNAKVEIEKRLRAVSLDIQKLEKKSESIAEAIAGKDVDAIEAFLPRRKEDKKSKGKSKRNDLSKYVREYTSTDGLPILVGKKSKDNDFLTFRIARSLDVWLHAADYPGSHVVIRRNGKEEIPQRTLLEAAQLAAFYSKAKNEAKAAVRYTERKFVNKPKGAAPGLVSLASSKTVLIRPGIPDFEETA